MLLNLASLEEPYAPYSVEHTARYRSGG